jgi:hypothetical protein
VIPKDISLPKHFHAKLFGLQTVTVVDKCEPEVVTDSNYEVCYHQWQQYQWLQLAGFLEQMLITNYILVNNFCECYDILKLLQLLSVLQMSPYVRSVYPVLSFTYGKRSRQDMRTRLYYYPLYPALALSSVEQL